MIKVMKVNHKFSTNTMTFLPGEVYWSHPEMEKTYIRVLNEYAQKTGIQRINKSVEFIEIDNIFQRAHKDLDFKNLIIVRFGGIGDLIALTSICDYFSDCNIHFVTQERYFPIFDWFINKPKLYKISEPVISDYSFTSKNSKYNKWACYHSEGLIESGYSENWFELFFRFIGENNCDVDMLRPQLRTERINNNPSHIAESDKLSLLVCNKATAMMRSINFKDIYRSLPSETIEKYDIYAYRFNLSTEDIEFLKDKDVKLIENSTTQEFLLDCFDVDMVISIDTGALHFREGINKPAIGLYNSFTTDARTKWYQYTKSFNIKSECELQPCFLHERPGIKHCKKGNEKIFAAPCFDSAFNKTLIEQLNKIFTKYL